jgi:predicted O-methyltransferase YrrM
MSKNLEDIVDNSNTDKNTIHSYLPLYEKLFRSKKDTAKNVLEIGVWRGGSLKLWSKYFQNAKIYGVDILEKNNVLEEVRADDRVILHSGVDGYDEDWFSKTLKNNTKFDIMLDDGPHTLESMISFIKLYSQLMTEDGILIIEDVQQYDWLDTLSNEVPDDLKKFIKVYDLRPNKNRYDDIVFTIDKSQI